MMVIRFLSTFVIGLIIGWLAKQNIEESDTQQEHLLYEQLRTAQAEIRRLQAELATATQQSVPAAPLMKDRLEMINGIGPTFAKRFQEAGIHTFAELATLTVAQAREIASVKDWQKVNVEAWIAQAKKLAGNA